MNGFQQNTSGNDFNNQSSIINLPLLSQQFFPSLSNNRISTIPHPNHFHPYTICRLGGNPQAVFTANQPLYRVPHHPIAINQGIPQYSMMMNDLAGLPYIMTEAASIAKAETMNQNSTDGKRKKK